MEAGAATVRMREWTGCRRLRRLKVLGQLEWAQYVETVVGAEVRSHEGLTKAVFNLTVEWRASPAKQPEVYRTPAVAKSAHPTPT